MSRSGESSTRRRTSAPSGESPGSKVKQRPAAEALGQPPGLGGLAAPLAALEGDEVAGHPASSELGSGGRAPAQPGGRASSRSWLRRTSVNGPVMPDTSSAPSGAGARRARWWCAASARRGGGRAQRHGGEEPGAHDDQAGEPQREPHTGHGDRHARDGDLAVEHASLNRSSRPDRNGPTANATQHAEAHQRVERAEDPPAELVVDVLVQQREAEHVDRAGAHAEDADEQRREPERRHRRRDDAARPRRRTPTRRRPAASGCGAGTPTAATTPTATPVPRAKMRMPKPAAPASRTSAENTGPSGTSMPPPIRPVARPTFTARTTGLMKMNDQPSFSSWKACPKSMRRSPFVAALLVLRAAAAARSSPPPRGSAAAFT